jgi:hypothetical protein
MTFSFRNRPTLHYCTGKKVGECRIFRGNIKRFSGSYQTHDLFFIRLKMQSVGSKTNAIHRTMVDCVEEGVNKRHYLKVARLLLCFKELSYLSVQWLLSFTHEHLVKPTRKPRDAQILGARSPGLFTMAPNTWRVIMELASFHFSYA